MKNPVDNEKRRRGERRHYESTLKPGSDCIVPWRWCATYRPLRRWGFHAMHGTKNLHRFPGRGWSIFCWLAAPAV